MNEWVGKWIGRCFDGLLVECLVIGWMDDWIDGCINGHTDRLPVKVLYSSLKESFRVEMVKIWTLPTSVSLLMSNPLIASHIVINAGIKNVSINLPPL